MNNIQLIGSAHALFASLPILLFSAALLCDLLHYFKWRHALVLGHWMVIGAVFLCIPAMITGLAAAAPLDPNTQFLAKHRMLSYMTAICGSFYAGGRIAVMKWKFDVKPTYYIGLSILMVALVSWAGDLGGLLHLSLTSVSMDRVPVFET